MQEIRHSGIADWVVVNTHPHREALALEHLNRQGFDTYCPLVRKQRRQGSRPIELLRPLFPSYVFVRREPSRNQLRPILSTFGVRKLIKFGDRLGTISGAFIEGLKARENEGVIPIDAVNYAIGQKVRIANGPFDGLIATIVSIEERNRIVVLMDLMSRQVQVRVTAHQLGSA